MKCLHLWKTFISSYQLRKSKAKYDCILMIMIVDK